MRYYYIKEDEDIFEEVRVILNGGKAFVIERYDPISETWSTSSVNGLYMVEEQYLKSSSQ